jgi:ubiquinol-cytochrome c reductase cytochrome b subunit
MKILKALLRSVDEVVGAGDLLRRLGNTPVRPSWLRVGGPVLLVLLAVQVCTGIGLAFFYAPSTTTAWGSVFHIEEQVAGGSLLRGLHAFGATAIVLAVLTHLLLAGLRRRYVGPRRVTWVLGLCLIPLLATFALTGYLLPWDQKGYWATQVATGIMRGTPVVGDATARFFQGGVDLGSLTLTRFYSLHTHVLPLTLFALLGLHLRVWLRTTQTNPEEGSAPYWPNQAFRDLVVALVVLGAVALFAGLQGAGLEAPAEPNSDYPPRPEWYFAPLRELLKTVPEPWGSVVLPGLIFFVLASLPWIDERSPRVARGLLLLPFLVWGGLLGQTTLADLGDLEFQERRIEAGADALLARELARSGIPPQGAGDLLWFYPPRMGERLFVTHCQQCHAVDGQGSEDGPDLTDYLSLPWIRGVVATPTSPRFFGKVPELSQMDDLAPELRPKAVAIATFVRAQDPEAAQRLDPAVVAAGKAAYLEAECNACHPLTPGEADLGPNLAGYGTADWLMRFLQDPGHELFYAEDNQMPAYQDELSREELQALVIYLRTLDGDPPELPDSK